MRQRAEGSEAPTNELSAGCREGIVLWAASRVVGGVAGEGGGYMEGRGGALSPDADCDALGEETRDDGDERLHAIRGWGWG